MLSLPFLPQHYNKSPYSTSLSRKGDKSSVADSVDNRVPVAAEVLRKLARAVADSTPSALRRDALNKALQDLDEQLAKLKVCARNGLVGVQCLCIRACAMRTAILSLYPALPACVLTRLEGVATAAAEAPQDARKQAELDDLIARIIVRAPPRFLFLSLPLVRLS
jgi:hypothetical protein